MNKKSFTCLLTITGLGLLLTSCQAAPINATTKITSSKGAGSKTLSALVLVDGSSQIEPDLESFAGNDTYYYIEDSKFDTVTYTPKSDGAKVGMIKDGYLTNPNNKTSCQEIWNEFNDVVKSYIPTGFDFQLREIKSDNWDDSYMDQAPASDVFAFKGYVYSLTYSWTSVSDYIAKTKTLMGDSYEFSELKEAEDEGQKWAKIEKNDDGTYTWSEAHLVNYWSVYDIADKVTSSTYFNKAALGEDFKITTDNAFAVAMQEYQIGESDPVIVKIDNKSGLDENKNLKFISATGIIKEKNNNLGLYIGVGAAVVVVAGVSIGAVLITKKRKAAK